MKLARISIPLHRRCCAFCYTPLTPKTLHVDATNGFIILTCEKHFDDAPKLFELGRRFFKMLEGKQR